jgi:hypothetical protein
MVSLHLGATSLISIVALPSSSSTNSAPLVARNHLLASALIGIVIAVLLLFSFFLILFYFIQKQRHLRLHPLNSSYTFIEPFPFPSVIIMSLRRREVGRRKKGREYEAGNVQARALIKKASPGNGNPLSERVGPDEPPGLPVGCQPLHRRTSLVSEFQETKNPSVAPTERQQELREQAESMRSGIAAFKTIRLSHNIPEEQQCDAQAELQQLRSTMVWPSRMEQSDWARGLVDKSPPAYNTLLGRQTRMAR